MKRIDGWVNALLGYGGSSDKTRGTKFSQAETVTLTSVRLLYDEDWLAQRIVDILPDWALRHGVEVDQASEDALKKLVALNYSQEHPKGCLQFALKMGRLEGGCALLLGLKSPGGDVLLAPSDNATLEWLDVVRRDQLRVVELDDDPQSAGYGRAAIYEIIGNHNRRGLRIHADRLLWCEGRETAAAIEDLNWIATLPRQQGLPDWGSELQAPYGAIKRYGLSWNSVSHMIHEASIPVFKFRGLIKMLSAENQEAITNRFTLMNLSRSVARAIYLDSEGDEEYKRVGVSFSGLAGLVEQIATDVSGAANTPGTILFGYSPKGMNATGESDLSQWFGRVSDYQTTSIKPKLTRLLKFCGASDPQIEFERFDELSEKDKADVEQKHFQTRKEQWTIGLMHEDEIRRIDGERMGLTEAESNKPAPSPEDKNAEDTQREQTEEVDPTGTREADPGPQGSLQQDPGSSSQSNDNDT